VTKVKDRLPVSKKKCYKFDMEKLDLKKLNKVESKEQHRVEVSNRFAAL
jgi:hypothetical protein